MSPRLLQADISLLVISNRCEKKVHTLAPDADPETVARSFCQPHNWLVCICHNQTPVLQFERIPGFPVRWRRVPPVSHAPRRKRLHP